MHHVFEDDLVNVLAEQVHEEPVTHLRLLHDDFDAFGPDASVADFHQVGSNRSGKAYKDTVDNNEECECAEDEHPEPQEDVNLLIENVQGENAQCVVLFNFTG